MLKRERESGVRKAKASYCTYSSLVKLQPWCLSLLWKTCLRAELQLGAWVRNESLAFGQNTHMMMMMFIIITVFCPRGGPSLQAQEPRLQFCRRQIFHRTLNIQGCSFTRDWIGTNLSDLKKSEKIPGVPTSRWGEWIWLTGPSGLPSQGFWPDHTTVNRNNR